MIIEEYKYDALPAGNFMRVLTLLPEEAGEELECTIQLVDLPGQYLQEISQSPPKTNIKIEYDALSYVWGNKNPPSLIICEGKAIQITRNLEEALLHLRFQTEPRTLWVDNICIDQGNVLERNHQVNRMGQIYSKAKKVLVWLGPSDEDTEPAFAAIRELHENVKPAFKQVLGGFDHSLVPPGSRRWLSATNLPSLFSLLRLLEKPWFDRAWTYQELLLAERSLICCGEHQISGDYFGSALRTLVLIYWHTNSDFAIANVERGTPMFRRHDIAKMKNSSELLLYLLKNQRGKQASDSRDLVYSILGIYNAFNLDGEMGEIEVDYRKDLRETYASIARVLLPWSLGQVLNPSITGELPSWVPDWRIDESQRYSFTFRAEGLYYATGRSRLSVRESENPMEIKLLGIKTDIIASIADLAYKNQHMQEFMSRLESKGRNMSYPATGESIKVAFSRTKSADIELTKGADFVRKGTDDINVSREYTKLFKENSLRKRRIFTTENLKIGLAPIFARDGDIICLLLGAEAPFVLRRVPDTNKFRFVGECYVHGLMDGEGLIEAMQEVNPAFEGGEQWLDSLYALPEMPFPTDEITII